MDKPCRIEGCDRAVGPKGAKGLCPKHYQAERLHSTAPPCSVDGCEKRSQTRGMCPMHYQRARLRGDAGGAEAERQRNVGACSVEGCGQPMRKRGWCASHYAQWYKTGQVKPFTYKWGEGGYVSTHKWVRKRKGDASAYRCVDCGERAAEWSYDGLDPDALVDPVRGSRYSRDLDRYAPRCVKCHRYYDGNLTRSRHT